MVEPAAEREGFEPVALGNRGRAAQMFRKRSVGSPNLSAGGVSVFRPGSAPMANSDVGKTYASDFDRAEICANRILSGIECLLGLFSLDNIRSSAGPCRTGFRFD